MKIVKEEPEKPAIQEDEVRLLVIGFNTFLGITRVFRITEFPSRPLLQGREFFEYSDKKARAYGWTGSKKKDHVNSWEEFASEKLGFPGLKAKIEMKKPK